LEKKGNLIIAMILSLLIYSCSRGPIKETYYPGFSEIKKGEEATIEWSFENADRVRIEGYDKEFKSSDKVVVSPLKTTKYTMVVYQDDKDTALYDWRVYVRSSEKSEPQRGPEVLSGINVSPSYEASKYFRGIISPSNQVRAKQLKIIRKIYPNPLGEEIGIRALLLDEFGNYISGLNNEQVFSYSFNGQDEANQVQVKSFGEKSYSASVPSLHLSFLLDNSAAAEFNSAVFGYLKESIAMLHSDDVVTFAHFNQNFRKYFEFQSAASAFLELSGRDLPPHSGLNALYKAAYFAVGNHNEYRGTSENLLILITYSNDNSSIVFGIKDVVEFARNHQLPIYIIGIGDGIETFNLKYLADASGGRFYFVPENDLMQIKSVMKEIIIGQRTYYHFPIKIADKQSKLSVAQVKSGNLFEKSKVIRIAEEQYSYNQLLSAFSYRDSTIGMEFDENFSILAQLLRDNPGHAIQLVGHSSIEGNNEFNSHIALKRAQEARRKLLELGASPNQLRVRSESNNMPIYYLQNVAWQQYYNRRVEIRWLDPELMPFEIVAGQFNSEYEALLNVESWEKKGFKAYYQRYLKDNFPMYRIKLWGYRTLDDAESTVRILQKDSKLSFFVE
jgi:outer membrane protein OmpA-like peptidoglycan-associated protein